MQMRNKEKGKLTIIISGMLLVSMISMWACSGEKMEAGVLSQQETTEYGIQHCLFFILEKIRDGLEQWKNYVRIS